MFGTLICLYSTSSNLNDLKSRQGNTVFPVQTYGTSKQSQTLPLFGFTVYFVVAFAKGRMEQLWSSLWTDVRKFPKEVGDNGQGDNQDDILKRLNDLAYVPLLSIGIYLLRKTYERFIAIPFARSHKLPDGLNKKQPFLNAKLESFFKKTSKHPSKEQLEDLSKRTDISIPQLRIWFRRRRNSDRSSLQRKFCEASWRFLFYTLLFTYGMVTLWNSSWFWDNQLCWEDFGFQKLDRSSHIYYMLESSFYLSLLLSVVSDVKRKDFTEQMIHHASTLFLIIFSYMATFVRVGTLVMAIHDVSDIFLELGKCFVYLRKPSIADRLFVIFAIVFIVSRLFIYPFWIIHTSAVKSLEVCNVGFVYLFFNFLLIVLLCLHIFWASIILKMAYKMSVKGEVEKDDRSDTEEETDSEDEN